MWLLAGVVLAALVVRAPAEPVKAKSAKQTVQIGATPGPVKPGVSDSSLPTYRLLARHYGISGLEESGTDAAPVVDEILATATRRRDEIRVVIASLPDPTDSHLASGFDAHVDALTRAASAEGYTLETWSFPWPRADSRTRAADLGQASAGAAEKTVPDEKTAARVRAAHRLEPGAVLFAKQSSDSAGGDQVLLMLLVGEAPTFGVHPSALHSALELFGKLDRSSSQLAFIGPTYSGSARGLRRLLSRWTGERCEERTWKVAALTGTATAQTVLGDLSDLQAGEANCFRIEAHGFTHGDRERLEAFEQYLKRRGDGDPKLAILSERATTYGEQEWGKESSENGALSPLGLSFPLHLAQLRTHSERSQNSEPTRERLESPLARSALGLAMEDESDAVDVPPSYSPRLSANVVELTLSNTLAALRRDDIRYVVLAATDTRDQLFLAQLLRRAAPEIHLVSFESDVLYSHPRFSQDLLGMLVVSSYPLTAKLDRPLQTWTGLREAGFGDRQDTFGSGPAEGTYRAGLVAIAGLEACGSSSKRASALPCGWLANQGSKRPPVWVSAVGRDTTWPIWVSGSGEAPSADAPKSDEALSIRPSRFFQIALLLLGLLGGFHGFVYLVRSQLLPVTWPLKQSATKPSASALGWLLVPPPRLDDSPSRRFARWGFLSGVLVLLAVPSSIALGPFLVARQWTLEDAAARIPELFVFGVACTCLLAPASFDALVRWIVGAWGAAELSRPRRRLAALTLTATSVAIVSLGTGVVGTPAWADRANFLLFSSRATHTESGLSPIAPIFLFGTGLVVMSVIFARRFQLFEWFAAGNPLRAFPNPSASGALLSTIEPLRRQLYPFGQITRPTPLGVAAFAAFIVVPGAALLSAISLPLDSTRWKWAFACGAIALVGTVVYSTVAFLSVWAEMRKLMRALASSPLRDAFGRLPIRVGRSVGLEPTAAPQLVSELQYCVDQRVLITRWLERLAKTGAKIEPYVLEWGSRSFDVRPSHVADLEALSTTLRGELRAAAGTYRRTPVILSNTQTMLASQAAQLLRTLDRWWAEGDQWSSSEEAGSGAHTHPPASAPRPMDAVRRARAGIAPVSQRFWFDLAEEFVAAQVTTFISYLFVHLRSSLRGTTAALVLLLLAMTIYPFEPQVPALNFLVVLIGAAVMGGLITFTQASRNELLSLIEGTEPNQVTWNGNLVLQIATYVAIPLLAATAAQMPMLGRMVSTLFGLITTR